MFEDFVVNLIIDGIKNLIDTHKFGFLGTFYWYF